MPDKFKIAKNKLRKSLLQLDGVLVYIDELEKEKDYYKNELEKAISKNDFKPYTSTLKKSTQKPSPAKKGGVKKNNLKINNCCMGNCLLKVL